jgi:hypothetical protein
MWTHKPKSIEIDPTLQASDGSQWRPVQDPTFLTNNAIRLSEEKTAIIIDGKFTELQTQIDAWKTSSLKFEADLQRVPTSVTTEVGYLKELLVGQINALQALMLEKFSNVTGQFSQRDLALIAALQAAKEAVTENNKATAAAAAINTTNFGDSIKSLQNLFGLSDNNTKSLIGVLAERITKLESIPLGVQQAMVTQQSDRTSTETHAGQKIAWIIASVSVLGLLISLYTILQHVGTSTIK